MNLALLVVRVLLSSVFAVAAIAKLGDAAGTRKSLPQFGVPKFLIRAAALLLPLAELVCAAALIPMATAWWGATGAMLLLFLFSTAIGFNLSLGRKPDCHCFGKLHSAPIGWGTLVRNCIFGGLAAWLVSRGPRNPGASLVDSVSGLNRQETVVLVLAIGLVALAGFEAWMLAHILRQNGRLLSRIETLEARPAAARTEEPATAGLPENSPAPPFSLSALDGDNVTLEDIRRPGLPLLLLFVEPGCGACDEALPEIAAWQRQHAERITVIPISRGEAKANRTKMAQHGLRDVLLQTGRDVAEAYHVNATPAAVLVKDGLIGSPVATGMDAIRELVFNATLPPPVKKGDLMPSLRLPDLAGKSLDLAGLRGRRTLLLFWNPRCGFCREMIEDVKSWERKRPREAPDLVVISTGSVETNREQGFRSPVLLDPYFGAGQVFGSGGTPSAVVLDEAGRVASEMRIGVPDVLALLGAAPAESAQHA